MNETNILTIFTPTYNRESTLKRCYTSLKNQDRHDFEWLIIDDGSTDSTKNLIFSLKEQAPFQITYIYQENAGKQAAWNNALNICKTKYFMCLDSDDALIENILNKTLNYIYIIETDNSIAGIRCNAINSVTQKNESEFFSKNPIVKSWFDEVINNKYIGEKLDIFKTQVLKNNYFPVKAGIKFIPESWLYSSIAKKGYNFLYLPLTIRIFYDDVKTQRLSSSSIKKHCLGHYIYRAHLLHVMPINVWIKNPVFLLKTIIRFSQTAGLTNQNFSSRRKDSNSFFIAFISYILQHVKI